MDVIKESFKFLTSENGFSSMNCIYEGNIDVALEMRHKKVTLTCCYDRVTKEFWSSLTYPNIHNSNIEHMEVNPIYIVEALTSKLIKCDSSTLKDQVLFYAQILKDNIDFIISPNFSIIRKAVKLQNKQFRLKRSKNKKLNDYG